MYEICEEQGVLLMEAFAFRHAPLVQKVKEVIDKGAIGKVKYIESHLTDVLTDMSNIRMNQSLGGGSFYDMACYNISTISYLLGFKTPVKVKALAEMDQERGVDVSNTTLLMYEDGTQAVAYSSLNSYSRGYYAVVGEKGRIEVPCNFNCRYVQKFTVTTEGVVNNVEILDEKRRNILFIALIIICLRLSSSEDAFLRVRSRMFLKKRLCLMQRFWIRYLQM